MRKVDPRDIAVRHYLRRKADQAIGALTIVIDARRELRSAIAQAQAQGVCQDPGEVRDLERELERELLVAAAAYSEPDGHHR
jgi:hypothetical protein